MSFWRMVERWLPAGRARFTRAAALLLLAVFALCGAVMSQPQQPEQTPQQPQQTQQQPQGYGQNQHGFGAVPPSDLALENANYVAASAQEIEAVLRQQPGLLVELQQWIGRDATDHGQMVDERGMSQDGIFDRLGRDRKFRAVATRLLQRYGYLTPEVNPNSQLGKQQQLEFLAKQKRLQQPPASAARQETSTFYPVLLPPYPSNVQSPPPAPRRQGTQPIAPAPPLGPAPATPQNPDTNGLMSGADFPARSATDPEGNTSRARMEQELRERGAESPGPPQGTLARPTPYYQQTGRSYQEKSPRPRIVHRANPYSDIPSLYDLYEQVSAHSPKLERFGLDVFENAPADTGELPMDLPAGPGYVVGPGDGLTINLWGSMATRIYRVVDREGRLSLPEVGPLMVSGETMGEVQQKVQQVLRTQYRGISADVSLARLRTVRVYVVGEIKYPGAYDISSLSTPLNALLAAGGPKADGSLRRIRHYRGEKLVQDVDLYDLLLHGVRSDLQRLENGDTILVPPVGPEVKVEGTVRRPAIYELHGEKTLAQVLQLAGGILPTAALRHIEVQRVEAHEKRTMLSLNIRSPKGSAEINRQFQSFAVHDGDIIRIFPIAPYNLDAVYLEGHVLRPGRYSYRPGMRLGDVISSYSDLLPEPATHYAEIIRLNPPDYFPSVESFDLAAALAHPRTAPKLHPLDTVRIFSRFNFQNAPTVTVGGEVRDPGTYRASGVVRVRDAIYQAGGVAPDADLNSAQLVRSLPDGKLRIMSIHLRQALDGDPRQNLLLEPRDRILVQRNPLRADPASVYVVGQVERPGRFPLTSNLRVSDLVGLAGGFKRSADKKEADLTSYVGGSSGPGFGKHEQVNLEAALKGSRTHDPGLHDGDVLTIKEIPGWNDIGASVTIRGEVSHPGTYGIAPGERLSSVLERAGGYLPAAYPQAAVLDRLEVRNLQEKARNDLIQEVQQNATNVKVSVNESAADQAMLQNAALQQREQVLEALRNAPITGRLVVHLNKDLHSFAGSPDDIQVRAGDTLVVPKRPDFVVVTGQVYDSNAITLEPGRTAAWYLRQAGGVTGLGNKKAIFVVRADGSVVSGSGGVNSWWRGDVLSTRMGAGDTIVVPEKPIGGSTLWKNLIQISQVAASSAIAAAVATR